jgi:hypothetical protein
VIWLQVLLGIAASRGLYHSLKCFTNTIAAMLPQLHAPPTDQAVCCTILAHHSQEASALDEAMPYHDTAR